MQVPMGHKCCSCELQRFLATKVNFRILTAAVAPCICHRFEMVWCVRRHLPEFLQRLEDADHQVRKETVLLLSAAAHARPALAAPCLPASLPLLLKLTAVDKSLVRVVDLGPFKQTVDDGLSMRKHTFECLEVLTHTSHHVLWGTCLVFACARL
jgi:TATA-binding protein interacting (TIP20)